MICGRSLPSPFKLIRKYKSSEKSACEATRACLMDGGYYLWNTAVSVIDSTLYLLLTVLGNVLPVEELCCDFHSWAFNMEFNDEYEKLMAVFVPRAYYTRSRGAKTNWEAWICLNVSQTVQNKQENISILAPLDSESLKSCQHMKIHHQYPGF